MLHFTCEIEPNHAPGTPGAEAASYPLQFAAQLNFLQSPDIPPTQITFAPEGADGAQFEIIGNHEAAFFIEALIKLGQELDKWWKPGVHQPKRVIVCSGR